ncbi:MAG: phosphoribosylamine--glycine ligase [Dehalococcoidia bacterium]|nr:phosphoribosylamine--glycine ligase [Dehalococcoidia bacterium]
MRVLIVGSGGREHALAWKIRQSSRLDALYVSPGNAGTAAIADNLPVKANDIEGIVRVAREQRIDLVVVGPEEPLTLGLVDALAAAGIAAFGPTKAAAELEASKVFAKELMVRHGIPTARHQSFDSMWEAGLYIAEHKEPLVIKADGLTAGKGAIVTRDAAEALEAADAILCDRVFGAAGARIVVEERLSGRETSAQAFTDGRTVVSMPLSCDHKPVFDYDEGPNTGGMGAYSPPGWIRPELVPWIHEHVTQATVRAMAEEGRPYCGVLYPGLLVTENGPNVLEFNCRFGDPETQAILPRLKSDLLEILWAVANGRLHEAQVEWRDEPCVAVVLASGGYPGKYDTGFPIRGLDELDEDAIVFHAGTRRENDGQLVTSGGRVMAVTALGATLEEARRKAYTNVERIRFEGMHYRRDIGGRRFRPRPEWLEIP